MNQGRGQLSHRAAVARSTLRAPPALTLAPGPDAPIPQAPRAPPPGKAPGLCSGRRGSLEGALTHPVTQEPERPRLRKGRRAGHEGRCGHGDLAGSGSHCPQVTSLG